MPGRKFSSNLLRFDAKFHHHHQHVISQIRHFVYRFSSIAGLSGDDNLGALLTDLFQDFINALLKEITGI